MKKILDVCCGSRMFWFDKKNPDVIFCDNRYEEHTLCDGRKLEIKPDFIMDFRSLEFDNDTFNLVVFDPPHLTTLGKNSWMALKYGRLDTTWKDDLLLGFNECIRVLKPSGVLIFKWSEVDVKLKEVLDIFPQRPLFGHTTTGKRNTIWCCFIKEENKNETK